MKKKKNISKSLLFKLAILETLRKNKDFCKKNVINRQTWVIVKFYVFVILFYKE